MPSPAKFVPPFLDPNRPILRVLDNSTGELGAAPEEGFVADLSHLGILTFAGDDAGSFLQSQLSCDVDAVLSKPISTFGSYCTPSGRMLASFLLWQQEGVWYMVLSRSLLASTQKRLSMYVLRAKVRIFAPQDMVLLGVGGLAGEDALRNALGVASAGPHSVQINEGLTAVGIPGQRCLLMVPATKAAEIWNSLSGHLRIVGTSAWELSDLHSGIPWITVDTQDQLVPQMANLELIGGVSFKKGCYPGQEIVARTQHLGKVKRRMYLAHVPAPAEAGAQLHSDDVGGQKNGMVVNAVPKSQGGTDMLVVIQSESAENSRVHLAAPDGPVLQFMPLPYPMG